MGRGWLITFEGIEGSGKSTQVRMLGEALNRRGLRTLLTREPGGTRIGAEIRRILLGPENADLSPRAELFLYLADRAQHVRQVIVPALAEGSVVICDRFIDATAAYQGAGRGIAARDIARLNLQATEGTIPDRTFLLDFEDVAEGLARAVKRNEKEGLAGVEDRFEQEEVDFHRRVRDAYREIAAAEPERFQVLSASPSVPELHESILSAALAVLGRGR